MSNWLLRDGLGYGTGAYDGVSAMIVKQSRAEFIWVGSFAVSASFARPDASQIDASEMASVTRVVEGAPGPAKPIVVDMDAGYGDTVKVGHASKLMQMAGAAALCVEDNPLSKQSSLYEVGVRVLASAEEHCARLLAARNSVGEHCKLIARTEALVAGLGLDEALQRGHAYIQAGADALLVQATKADGGDELLEFCARWNRESPLFVAPTCYPHLTRSDFKDAGASHVVYANHLVRAAIQGGMRKTVELLDQDCVLQVEEHIAGLDEIALALGHKAVPLHIPVTPD